MAEVVSAITIKATAIVAAIATCSTGSNSAWCPATSPQLTDVPAKVCLDVSGSNFQ